MTNDSDKSSDVTEHHSQQELLLQKIQRLLQDSDPDRWVKGGEPLQSEMRFEKPRQAWEEVYTYEISAGILVMRSSLPVRSEFQGRGFFLMPNGKPKFSVEVRASSWHHSELTDPYKRSRSADRRLDVLAEGTIAEELYNFIENQYRAFHSEQQEVFNAEVDKFVSKLPHRLKDETVNRWDRTEEISGEIHLTALIDGYSLDCCKTQIGTREKVELIVQKGRRKTTVTDRGLLEELLHSIDQVGQTAKLMTLTKALEG